MTFVGAMEKQDCKIVAMFAVHLSVIGYPDHEIEYALEKPWKFEDEFALFYDEYVMNHCTPF